MKRFSGLLLLTILFVLAGCRGTDQYSIERKYWKAKKLKEMIVTQPEAYTAEDLKKSVQTLKDFIQDYPANTLAIEAKLDIATLYMVKSEYEKARDQLREIVKDHASSQLICSEALFLIGNSYQVEGKWDMALVEYQKIKQDYPQTSRGLDIPIYIARYYKSSGQPRKMASAYREAIEFYTQLSQQYPNTQLGFHVSRLAGRCYMELEDWAKALGVFQNIINTYSGKIDLDDILMNIAIIYAHELKDIEKASLALEQLVKDYPSSRFIKAAEFMLKEWKR